jgi:uncharacterized protein YndB with AHSA1/START domain
MNEVEREIVVPGTPEEAWRAVVESDWLGEEVRIEARPGGEVAAREPGGEEGCAGHASGEEGGVQRRGFVEEADPPHRLVFWWNAEDEDATRVEIDLEQVADGTRVRVVESRPLAVLDAYGSDLGAAIGVRGPQALAV